MEDKNEQNELNFGESLDTDPELQEAAGEHFTAEESGLEFEDAAEPSEFGESIGNVETPDDFEAYEEKIRGE